MDAIQSFIFLATKASPWEILVKQSKGLADTIIVIFIIIFLIVFGYPLGKYLVCRVITLVNFNFLLGTKSKGAFMFKRVNPLSPLIPSWSIKKPDFILYSKGVTYVVKLHSFYMGRKKVIFVSDERWAFTRQPRRKKFDAVFEKKVYEELKTKPAPEYMISFSRQLAKEIDGPVVPVILHAPSVKFMETKNGVIFNNGDYTFYGMIISDIKTLSGKVSAAGKDYFPEALTAEEKQDASQKIKNVIKKG